MVAVPRLVIAAPASGSGKTTVACGLMAALRATGLAVSRHKAGPDDNDPGYPCPPPGPRLPRPPAGPGPLGPGPRRPTVGPRRRGFARARDLSRDGPVRRS